MSKRYTLIYAMLLMAFSINTASALQPKVYPDTIMIPERAIVVSGNELNSRSLIAVLYDNSELHYNDPSAPRFLFFDRKGKVALGIGGYIKGTMHYDFGGSIDDGGSFTTYDIPVPNNPAQRNAFYGNANHSTIFLQLVGKSEKFGYYQMYVQTNFSGNGNTGYGLKLKQAYLKLGYVTAGLASSTFVDGSAGTPVIEDQGPAGELSCKNILVRYAPRFNDHFSGAIGLEAPRATYTFNTPENTEPSVEKISQRCPDIPLYVQYEWGGGASHIRLSGLFRGLSYRDLVNQSNHFKAGWAVQLSGKAAFTKNLTFFYQGAYGRGYATYINDLEGFGFDMVETDTPGKMTTPKMANFELGLRYNFLPNLFATAVYSQSRLIDQRNLGPDTYRYGQYTAVSCFYDIVPELRIGLEYLRGDRADMDHTHGHANRLVGLLQYTF